MRVDIVYNTRHNDESECIRMCRRCCRARLSYLTRLSQSRVRGTYPLMCCALGHTLLFISTERSSNTISKDPR